MKEKGEKCQIMKNFYRFFFMAFSHYVGNITCDISGITRKDAAENRTGAADFLIMEESLPHGLTKISNCKKQK